MWYAIIWFKKIVQAYDQFDEVQQAAAAERRALHLTKQSIANEEKNRITRGCRCPMKSSWVLMMI